MKLRALSIAVIGCAALSGGCRERGRPDPQIRMAISHDPESPAAREEPGRSVPTRLEVPPEVGRAYSGIRLRWTDSSTQKEGVLEVPLEGSARVPGTALDVRAEIFLPSFTMTEKVITSAGVEPDNPAARVQVTEEGNPVFAGWIFTRFPDVHPFTHPRISLRLEGGVRRTAS